MNDSSDGSIQVASLHRMLDERHRELLTARAERRDKIAAALVSRICLDDEYVDFLTLPAYDLIVEPDAEHGADRNTEVAA